MHFEHAFGFAFNTQLYEHTHVWVYHSTKRGHQLSWHDQNKNGSYFVLQSRILGGTCWQGIPASKESVQLEH